MVTTMARSPEEAVAPPPGVPWGELARESRWILAAAAIGFAISAIGAQGLHLPRHWIVMALAISVTPLIAAYARSKRLDIAGMIRHHWVWALVRGVAMGLILVVLVLPDDPTAPPRGTELAFDVVWLGAVYGAAEALLVNVLPMMAAWQIFVHAGLTRTIRGKVAAWLFTIVANLLVTSAYNLGFPEFRGPEISGPVTSNFLIGVGFVMAPNPMISIVSHVVLHIASVLAGSDGPVNLPPHYA
jgi:hypothetical protein